MTAAIRVEHLGKRYRLSGGAGGPAGGYRTLRESLAAAAAAPFRRLRRGAAAAGGKDFWALDDVSFEVRPGEVVGVIGRNGAGKSTLLKVLSRITKPTTGRVTLAGRVGSLLEVGTGFHPELTGRENVFLNGSILGMKRAEIRAKFDEIVAFAEVEQFLDTPVKRYSSGMYVRLAFAVAAHLDPEILIVDEVLAVGDQAFQQKCLGKMNEATKHDRTVLFVSHNMAAVRSLCRRCMVLEGGKIKAFGPVEAGVAAYLAGVTAAGVAAVEFPEPAGAGCRMRAARVAVPGGDGGPMHYGDDLEIVVEYEASPATTMPQLGVVVSAADGTRVLNANSHYQPGNVFDRPAARGTVSCRLHRPPLMAGTYTVSLWFGTRESDTHVVPDALAFAVAPRDVWGGGKVPPGGASACWQPATFSNTPG